MNYDITLPLFESLHSAYYAVLRQLREHGNEVESTTDSTSVGSRFGKQARPSKELVGVGFRIRNPRARVINAPQRRFNLSFAIANTLWVLRGSNSLSEINFYNARATDFSDDGSTLSGAAGFRLLRSQEGSQLMAAIDVLRKDATSRRAVVHLLQASDLRRPHRDTPCTIALQFIIRSGLLNCIAYVRSQSAAFVLPYDVFLFTMIQEAVACELHIDVGTYHHFCGSLHYYSDESDLVESLLGRAEPAEPPAMAAMESSPIGVDAISAAEVEVRAHIADNKSAKLDLSASGLDVYWGNLIKLLGDLERERRMTHPH